MKDELIINLIHNKEDQFNNLDITNHASVLEKIENDIKCSKNISDTKTCLDTKIYSKIKILTVFVSNKTLKNYYESKDFFHSYTLEMNKDINIYYMRKNI